MEKCIDVKIANGSTGVDSSTGQQLNSTEIAADQTNYKMNGKAHNGLTNESHDAMAAIIPNGKTNGYSDKPSRLNGPAMRLHRNRSMTELVDMKSHHQRR